MSDKTISGYAAGEYLLFQKDVVPEINEKYDVGTRSNPFYAVCARKVPLTNVPYIATSAPPWDRYDPDTLGDMWYFNQFLRFPAAINVSPNANVASFTMNGFS